MQYYVVWEGAWEVHVPTVNMHVDRMCPAIHGVPFSTWYYCALYISQANYACIMLA
jgi:hypothetical protein